MRQQLNGGTLAARKGWFAFVATLRILAVGRLAALVGVMAISSSAFATEPESRPFLVELRSGFNTSTDMIGVVGSIHAWNRVGAGLGIGLDPWLGPQFAALLRFRPLLSVRKARQHALLTEVAFSQGRYRHVFPVVGCDGGEEPCPRKTVSDVARWGHVDLAWETQSTTGLSVRLGVGAGLLLNPSSLYCEPGPCSETARTLASLTVGFGYAF